MLIIDSWLGRLGNNILQVLRAIHYGLTYNPNYVLVEFDLFLKRKDTDNSTQRIVQRILDCNYTMLKNDNCNITFCRNIK